MHPEDTEITDLEEAEYEDFGIDRADTLIRLVYTILYVLGLGILESVIYALAVFQLGYTLVTKSPPSETVNEVANRLVSYYYRVLRYITHNDVEKPFPFSDFPAPVEPPYALPEGE